MNVINKYLDLKIFFISFALGLLYIHIVEPKKKVYYIHPTKDNIKDILYKDFINNCYELNIKEVSCYENESNIENIKYEEPDDKEEKKKPVGLFGMLNLD